MGRFALYSIALTTIVTHFVCLGGTYLQGTVGSECSLIILFGNLHPGDSLLGCILFYNFPSMGLSARCYRLFIKLRTCFQGTARVSCSLFIRFLNLPAGNCLLWWSLLIWLQNLSLGDCHHGVQLVLLVLNLHPGDCLLGVHSFCMVSKPSSRGLSAGDKKNLLSGE